MNLLTISFIFMAILLALLLVYLHYFYKERQNKTTYILAVLRFITIFSILLLVINPKISKNINSIIKPKLLVAMDNSSSINFSKQEDIVKNIFTKIQGSKGLSEKFDIDYFTFGNSIQNSTKLTFKESQTNIIDGLKDLNALAEDQISPIILISDGNQTFGSDYKYYQSKQPIYPVIIGDTLKFADLEISQINVNAYTYVDNQFPVEVFINYTGEDKINTNFVVTENDAIIYRQKVNLSKENNFVSIPFYLSVKNIGKHLYTAKIEQFKKEKNILNNSKNFSIDGIDEQTNIAIIYDILHPDIGMLKNTIEINPQRKVNLIDINVPNQNIKDNNIYIFYQPNVNFKSLFDGLSDSQKNYFIITGKNTDWDFLNQAQKPFEKNILSNSQEFLPEFNKDFNIFQVEDIGFSNFSPLEDSFGEIKFKVPYTSILTQNIDGIATDYPLLASYNFLNQRAMVLFGENIWKWRVLSYASEKTFEKFDNFFNAILQYLTITTKTKSIDLSYKPFFYADEPVIISAKSYDANLNFDPNANLELILKVEKEGIPFLLKGNNFEVTLNNLKSGAYDFQVKNMQNAKTIGGKFTVIAYAIEQESTLANTKDLQALANNSRGKVFFPYQSDDLFEDLINNAEYVSFQKQRKQTISFIDWKWLLGIIVLSLFSEWFIRKLKGLI